MPPTMLNFEEADVYRRTIDDPITRELTGLVFTQFVKNWLSGDRPVGAIDMLHLVKVLEEAFASHEVISQVLRGESLLWPDVNESQEPLATESQRDEIERRPNSLTSTPANIVWRRQGWCRGENR